MQVILNLVERNQLKPLDMPISVSNFITGMVTDKIVGNLENFHYHPKCRHISDNAGAIELGREKSLNHLICLFLFGW